MRSRCKDEISRTILNIFRPYNGIDVFKLPFLEELYEKTFVVPHEYCFSFTLQEACCMDKVTRMYYALD